MHLLENHCWALNFAAIFDKKVIDGAIKIGNLPLVTKEGTRPHNSSARDYIMMAALGTIYIILLWVYLMSDTAAVRINEKEFIRWCLFVFTAYLVFFPNMATTNGGEIDYISIPLVGFPIMVSLILLAFASQEKSSRMQVKCLSKIGYTCFFFHPVRCCYSIIL